MKIALTGGTGYVGSHILRDLVSHGHDVSAIVRDDKEAESVRAKGASAAVVDLFNRAALVNVLRGTEGAIHTASPGDETSADLDAAVLEAGLEAFGSSGKPYIPISGLWIYGNNTDIVENSVIDAPAMVAWKPPLQEKLLSESGLRGVVVVSSTAYGDGGGGIPGALLGSPRDEGGNLIMVGSGRQHWSTVHVADLADFFRRVVEDDAARGTYVIGNGLATTLAELTEAAAVAAGAAGAVPGSDAEARTRFGDYFAEVLLLDQGTQASRARIELGWEPTHPGLVEEFRSGSYRH